MRAYILGTFVVPYACTIISLSPVVNKSLNMNKPVIAIGLFGCSYRVWLELHLSKDHWMKHTPMKRKVSSYIV